MEKKGDLVVEEALRIILAVIGIGFLIYLIISFAGIFYGNHQKEQAKATLDNIVSKLETLEEGQRELIILESPRNWVIFYFSQTSDPTKKSSLNEKSDYLCICSSKNEIRYRMVTQEDPNFPSGMQITKEEQYTFNIPDCEKLGVCKPVKFNLSLSSRAPEVSSGISINSGVLNSFKSQRGIELT